MQIRERHRGRLIDHVGLVVRDLVASKVFYEAVFAALEIPIGGSDERYLWADELFIGNADSEDVQSELTGRHHLAFQAKDRAMVNAFYHAALAHGGRDNGRPASGRITLAITRRSSSIRMATISRPCSTANPSAARLRCTSGIASAVPPDGSFKPMKSVVDVNCARCVDGPGRRWAVVAVR